MREGFLTLVGFLLTITPALAQTTVPTTPAPTPGPTGAAGVADWWWVLLPCPRGSDFMRRRAQP
jgi:hypothetical protein